MNKFALAFCLVFLLVSAAAAQSGRRIATPLPTPGIVKVKAEEEYSESKPQPKRPVYYRPRPRSDDTTAKTTAPRPSGTPQIVDGEEAVTIETNLVTIPVSVFDRHGLYIPDLRQSDFKIFEDGVEQEIEYFGTTEKPFTVVLLLDTSPSTAYKIDEIRDAARAFVDQLKPQDRVMVIEFDANVNVLTEPTSDRNVIYKGIKKADFGGGTSLYDSVDYALAKRLNKIEGRKAIVLFTDGVDTTSRRSSYDETLSLAEESDTLIFPIYYNTFFDMHRGLGGLGGIGFPFPGRPDPGTQAQEYALGKRYLDELAQYTGGRVFRPEGTPGGLTAAFEGIAEELRRQYNIGYIPLKDGRPGQRKTIKVRVNRPNLVIRSRDSYIVPVK